MILSFSSHGKGQGYGPVKYVCDEHKHNGEKRSVKPEILRGDADETIALIDANKNSWKYTSLVISFTKEEFDDLLAEQVLDEFEKFAFANLDKNDYTFLAVLHKDTDNPHIHIICPRQNLTTQTDLNIAPKQQQKQWHIWSDYVRDKFDLKAIDNNSIDKSILSKSEKMGLSKGNLSTHSKAKIELDKFIKQNISNEFVTSRQDIKKLLESIDLVEKVELKNNSMSIKIKGLNKNIRLEGGIYGSTITNRKHENFSREVKAKVSRSEDGDFSNRHTQQTISRSSKANKSESSRSYADRNIRIEERYKIAFKSRVEDNSKRYKRASNTDATKANSIFSLATKENKKAVVNNNSSKHFDKFSSILSNNFSSVKAMNNALTNSVSDTIANLQDKLNTTQDAAARADILNQLESLLSIKYEQQRKLKF